MPPRHASPVSRRPISRNLLPLLQLLGFIRPYLGRALVAALALVVAAGSVLAFGQVIRTLVDSGLASGRGAALDHALLVFLAVVIVMALAVFGRSYLLTWLGERVVADLRRAVFERVLSLDVGYFETVRTGEIISRLTADTALLQVVFGSTLAMAARALLLIAGGIVMLAVTSPKLTALVLLGTPAILVPVWLIGYRVRRLSRSSQDRLADVGAYVDEALHAIRTVQAFCHEPTDRQRYAGRVEEAFAAARSRALASASLSGTVMLLTFAAIGLVLWLGGREVLAGRLSGGELSAFLFYSMLVASSIGGLSEVVAELMRGAGASERLLELLAQRPQITPPRDPRPLPEPASGRIEIRDLTFAYPAQPEIAAIEGLDVAIAAGERVALVGPSGAGKSTLFQLLLRFYDPQRGALFFDGLDLRTVHPSDLRRRIAIVPQDPVIFAADAWENIRYGLDDVDDEAVRRAADAAQASEFLDRLPQGFATFLGERGVRLSGGQRQRIAIARAILRDPALLLLDEATSALDAENERLVQRALETLMEGRTSLVIAHRLATVRKVDRILVIDRGRLIASGTHAQLMAEEGLYARLARLQFQVDRDESLADATPAG
ncbi:ABC transporter, permease/ATP-binding protein [Thioflavicoccus mobilis 8321]|uniref:ABC transporter, permease/ATP-binding protein n=1 Tax=Thioflavicoccus mobilis 8321 TaxID=765912 RepID=L0GZZ5_9GAMM|nr:ABC transporter transmembrane domain-containing protein [Thioflavicoccus mobilis]AGA91526.1 ABC transporter, permease/ATP-binding protein [Thioflavicoccus mobilis 8321]